MLLLFVKKRFADAIRDGSKTLEIRTGARYRNVRVGTVLTINGTFRRRVCELELHDSLQSLLRALKGRHAHAGFTSAADAEQAIRSCYPERATLFGPDAGTFYVFHLEPEP